MHLQQTPSSPSRRRTGRLLVVALAAVTGFAALAARAVPTAAPTAVPTAASNYAVAMTIDMGGGNPPHTVRVLTPGTFSVRVGEAERAWTGEFTLSPAGPGKMFVRSKISQDGKLMGEPGILAHLGASSAFKISGADGAPGLAVDMTVTQESKAVPDA